MKRLALVFTLLLSILHFLSGQDKKLMIRKAFESLDDKKEPATFSFTLPREGANSYLINGGISYSLIKLKHKEIKSVKTTLLPFFVLNKNTMIKKQQNNFKLGVTWNWKMGNLNRAERESRYFVWSNTGEYARNTMDTTHSLFWTSYFSMINSKDKKGSLYINTYKHMGKGFEYFVGWSVGPEYQYRFNAPATKDMGGIFRIYYSTEIRISKKIGGGQDPSIGNRVAELVVSNKGRYDLGNSTAMKEGYLPLIKTELIIYPTNSSDFSVGFSYNTGSDPIAGLAQQDFYLFAMKFKK